MVPILALVAALGVVGSLLDGCLDVKYVFRRQTDSLAHLNDLLCRTVHFAEGVARDLLGPQDTSLVLHAKLP